MHTILLVHFFTVKAVKGCTFKGRFCLQFSVTIFWGLPKLVTLGTHSFGIEYLQSFCFILQKTSVLVCRIVKSQLPAIQERPFGLHLDSLLKQTYGGINIGTGHISSVSCLVKTFSVGLFIGYRKSAISFVTGRLFDQYLHACVYCTNFACAYSELFSFWCRLFAE